MKLKAVQAYLNGEGSYEALRKKLQYYAIQMLHTMDGVDVAKQLIHKDGMSEGMIALWGNHRLDLSVEAHVLKPEFAALFTDEEKDICRNRLKELGYEVDN